MQVRWFLRTRDNGQCGRARRILVRYAVHRWNILLTLTQNSP